jgi:hypothetical protein
MDKNLDNKTRGENCAETTKLTTNREPLLNGQKIEPVLKRQKD